MSLIEDESAAGYAIRLDKMKPGQIIVCHEDSDMCVKKDGDSAILIKKSYSKTCFRQ